MAGWRGRQSLSEGLLLAAAASKAPKVGSQNEENSNESKTKTLILMVIVAAYHMVVDSVSVDRLR